MKTFLRILKWLFLSLLLIMTLALLLLLMDRDYRDVVLTEKEKQSIPVRKKYHPPIDSSLYFSLVEEFGNNKMLAMGFEVQCLLALSHYPELKDAPIDFLIKPAFLPLASRPDPVSLLFPWVPRKYLVIISNRSTDFFEPILLENTPFNEQVGIIGHELAHAVYYQDKSALQLAGIAFRYLAHDFVVSFERETDKRAIAHGLGYQMYDFAFFVRKAFGNSQEQIMNEVGGMYLSPKEIASEMKKHTFYKEPLDSAGVYFDEFTDDLLKASD